MRGRPKSFRRWVLTGALVGCGPTVADPDPAASTSATSSGAGASEDTSGDDATSRTSVADDAGSTGGGGPSQTDACAAYLSCAAAATPAELGALLDAYGPEGTCWQSTSEVARQCDMACGAGLAQLQDAFCDEPACGAVACPSPSDGAIPGAPVIVSVSWTSPPGCMPGIGSDVQFTIDVTDPDHPVSELTFSGQVIGCVGALDAPMSSLVCPNAAPYTGEVEVSDPDGNADAIELLIMPCVDGSAP